MLNIENENIIYKFNGFDCNVSSIHELIYLFFLDLMGICLSEICFLQLVNAAVIVDPAAQQIIASACDQICSSHVPSNSNINHTGLEPSNSADKSSLSVGLQGQPPTGSYRYISCFSPWRWIEKKQACSQSGKSSSYLHPLKHAAIVAIDNSASRDRRLYPNLGQIEKQSSIPPDSVQSSSVSSHSKRQRTNDIIVSPAISFIFILIILFCLSLFPKHIKIWSCVVKLLKPAVVVTINIRVTFYHAVSG